MNLKSIKLPNPNAVLYKDMKQKTKNAKLVTTVFMANLVLVLIAVIVMLVLFFTSTSYNTINYSTFNILFIAFSFIEFAFVALITPALTAGSITAEIEKQTFDVLLSTRLSPWQIVVGKFWASILQVLLLIISGFPVFSLVFIYGGISFFQAFAVLLVLMITAIFCAAIGVFASSLSKKTVTATVFTFVFVFAALFGTFSIVGTIKIAAELMRELIRMNTGFSPTFNGDIAYILLYVNPLTTLYDVLAATGLNLFDTSFPGMAGIISFISDWSSSNLLLRFWTIISIAVQLGLSFLFLKAAARNIDPLRKRKVKKVKGNGKKRTK